MMPILAHHLEAHHVGIAIALFAVGMAGGWMVCTRWLAAKSRDQQPS